MCVIWQAKKRTRKFKSFFFKSGRNLKNIATIDVFPGKLAIEMPKVKLDGAHEGQCSCVGWGREVEHRRMRTKFVG